MNYISREVKKKRLEIVHDLYLKGTRPIDIAKTLGCSPSTVSCYITELGIRTPKYELETRILRLHWDGYTNVEISYEVDISVSQVSKILKKFGIGKKYSKSEDNLIDENTKYAIDYNKNIKTEKLVIGDKNYLDVTQIYSPK